LKTLVLGLGNAILSDDSVGFRVIDQLKTRFDRLDLIFKQSSVSGIRLLEEIIGYDRLIIIDAIQIEGGQAGNVYHLDPKGFDSTRHTASSHGLSFTDTINLGKSLGLSLPQQITIFAIEAKDVDTFGERCTPKVEQAIPICADMVAQVLRGD
jgi:hydrogenase maturation protease